MFVVQPRPQGFSLGWFVVVITLTRNLGEALLLRDIIF